MTNVFDLLSLDFMQRALMAAVFTGLAAPVVIVGWAMKARRR